MKWRIRDLKYDSLISGQKVQPWINLFKWLIDRNLFAWINEICKQFLI